ncbi:MAG: hypothetical protein GPJ54_22720 [Candidatus Heimdallarchaeota archaeon]|nr:hypothetical protein [Candidatus Heimdallarchaeota archaeon]
MDDEEFTIIWGQDLPHCDEHCYEDDESVERWRCMNRDHVPHEDCSEDFLHCKIDFVIIKNPDGNNNYCSKHQKERELLEKNN